MAHTLESCKASASSHQSKQAWRTAEYGAMQAAVRNGWFDECTSHMAPAKRGTKPGTLYATTAEWVASARRVHGDRYDYSQTVFRGAVEKVIIDCPDHGSFSQVAWTHINGTGCPACGRSNAAQKLADSANDFILAARRVHGDRYDYSQVRYANNLTGVEIVCPSHGAFTQRPANHIHKAYGCPRCGDGQRVSIGEQSLFEYVKSLCPDAQQSNRDILGGRFEIDILIPSLNIGIEFNGLFWHSEARGKSLNYHQEKSDLGLESGVRILHIWEDEWRDDHVRIKGYLRRQLNAPTTRINARQCTVLKTTGGEQRDFLDTNHLQGFRGGGGWALLHQGEVVAVAILAVNQAKELELMRWCVKQDVVVVGGFTKVMSRVQEVVVSYCDTAKYSGAGYLGAGWELVSKTAPMVYYTNGVVRHGRHRFQKARLVKLVGNNTGTERELAAELGFFRIGGCAQIKFKLLSP